MKETTANVIAEPMYAQYEKYGNDMFLINYFVGYIKTEQMLSMQDQKLMVNGKPCMKRLTDGWDICFL